MATMGHWQKYGFLTSLTENDIYCNGRVKLYPSKDGEWTIGQVDFFIDRGAFRIKGFEENKQWKADYHYQPCEALDEVTYNPITGENVTKKGIALLPDSPASTSSGTKYNTEGGNDKGRRRAMVKIFDYVRCNWEFDCMFTLTFDAEKIDRTSYGDIVKSVGQWLSNRVRRNGLKYIAVPEFHKDGEAIHFHGVCNFKALQTKYSGVRQGGKGVYNITDFPYGFTAVKKFGGEEKDRHAVAVYVSKYITKASEKVGGRYYLHGGKLLKPIERLIDVTEEEATKIADVLGCKEWRCPTPIGGTYVKFTVEHFDE